MSGGGKRSLRPVASDTRLFAPDYAPEEIVEIARKLPKQAGLGDEPTGVVANPGNGDGSGVVDKVKDAVTP
jgi:Mn-containing catalase